MNRVVLRLVCVLACFCALTSCGSDETVSPSFVARTWSLQIGGAPDAEPEGVRGTPLDFGGSERVQVLSAQGSRVVSQACCDEWPLVVDGEIGFSLPPPPQTQEELLQAGLRLVGVTYCSFLNEAGVPREQDVRAVDEAMSSLLSLLEAPLQEAKPNDEEVSRVTELAAEALLKDVLRELEIPESEEEMLDAQGNQGLWFIGDLRLLLSGTSPWAYGSGGFPSELSELIDVLPSLVWVHGDPSTRSTLSACGSMLWFDAPLHFVESELGSQVDNECLTRPFVRFCSLGAYERNKPRLSMVAPDLRRVPFATWEIEPSIQFNRLRCVGRLKDHQASFPEGPCTTPETMLLYANLEYTNDYEETFCGAEAVGAIAQDCMIGAAPRCGTQAGPALSGGDAESLQSLADCVSDCTSIEVQRLAGADERSTECRSCYGDYVACAAADCAGECSYESECVTRFVECAGPMPWPQPQSFF